jgi:hypothetical protein
MTRKIEAKIGDINAKQKSGTPKILGCVAKMHFAHDGCHDWSNLSSQKYATVGRVRGYKPEVPVFTPVEAWLVGSSFRVCRKIRKKW